MSLENTIWIISHLLCFSLMLQALEVLLLTRSKSFNEIWSYNNLKSELEEGLPLPAFLIQSIFSLNGFRTILVVQIGLCLTGFLVSSFAIFAFLFLAHLLICIRFRGTFNGGSDMMTFVILTGVLIYFSSNEERIQKLGLIYIAIHTLYSYFKAGLVKIRHKEWRNGQAAPAFLERSIYLDMRAVSAWLRSRPRLSQFLGLGILTFELSAVLLPVFHFLVLPYLALAATFHFLNYLSFGLNRFFWIWLTAWPAVLYTIKLAGR